MDVSSQLFHLLCEKHYGVMERVLGPKSRDILPSSCYTAVIQPVCVSFSLNVKCKVGPNNLQSPIQLYSLSPIRPPFSVEEHHSFLLFLRALIEQQYSHLLSWTIKVLPWTFYSSVLALGRLKVK